MADLSSHINISANNISAIGNLSGTNITGDGSQLTSLPAPTVTPDISSNGDMSIMTYDGVIRSVNYATVEPSSGNIKGGNISATGNISGGNISATGNISGANIIGTYANGNSNVNIATANGNVTISSAGNTTMTITGTGAIITGIAKPTGTSVTGVNSVLAGPTFTPLANTMGGFVSNVNSYTQLTIQNKNTGTDATTDFIATADNGSDTVNYLDMGIINSGYDANTPTNSLGNIVFAADTYMYAQGNTGNASQSGGNLAIGTTVPGKNVKIFAGGVNNSSIIANIANTGVTVTGNVTVSGGSFVGNGAGLTNVTVNAAGNIQGTSSNVSLVAGSYTYTFDNVGAMTLPAAAIGNEGGEIQFTQAANSTLSGNTITIDNYVDQIRFFEGGGTARGVYIDLNQAAAGVGTLLNNRVSAFVNAGTFVTMDLIKATVTSSGNRGLSLATTTGTLTYNIGGTYGYASSATAGGFAASGQSLTTTPTISIFGWSFPSTGDTSTYILTDTTNSRAYRITLMMGASFNNNMISIERLI